MECIKYFELLYFMKYVWIPFTFFKISWYSGLRRIILVRIGFAICSTINYLPWHFSIKNIFTDAIFLMCKQYLEWMSFYTSMHLQNERSCFLFILLVHPVFSGTHVSTLYLFLCRFLWQEQFLAIRV